LHLSAKYGSINCLLFLLKFKNIDPNKNDSENRIPLDFLIENFKHFNDNNKKMFLSLGSKTKIEILSDYHKQSIFNSWQTEIYENYLINKDIKILCV